MKWFVFQYGIYNLITTAPNWNIAKEYVEEAFKRRYQTEEMELALGHGPFQIPTPDLKILDETYLPDRISNSVFWKR